MGKGLDLYCRLAFIVIAITLATLTHWPNLKVNIDEIPRTDLWAHAIAYSAWSFAFIATGWVAPRGSWKSVGLGMPIALLYAGIDEFTQGIPGLGRYVTLEDFGANAIGVGIGAGVWVAYLMMRDRRALS